MEASLNLAPQIWPSLRSAFLGLELQAQPMVVRPQPAPTRAQSRLRVEYRKPSALQTVFQGFLKLLLILTFSLGFAWFGPDASARLSALSTNIKTGQISYSLPQVAAPDLAHYASQVTQWLSQVTVTPIAGQSGQANDGTTPVVIKAPEPVYQPPYDATLPEGSWLSIPLIGLRSELQKTEDYETALAQGIWQVPDFGDAGSTDLPMIVAGHRFGWDWWWKTDYWKYHSFYKLPELQPGDRVEIIADHRKWIYEIYAGEEGTEITDYSADLILYTCKYLNSPTRFFRYARLVDPTKNSQTNAGSTEKPAAAPSAIPSVELK